MRHADRPLGAIAVDTARAAIADAGLTVADVDGFTTGSLLPSAGGQAIVDGVSVVTPNWLAESLGVNPRFAAGFQGYGQIPGSVTLAVNAIASGVAEVVVLHRALHNPPQGRYHTNPMTCGRGHRQWTAPQGYWGPLSMIALPYNEYLQRYGATRDELANVVVEARANGARIPWSYWYDKPPESRTTTSRRACSRIPICMYDCDIPVDGVGRLRVHDRRAGAATSRTHPVTSPGSGRATRRVTGCRALAARRHHGHRRRDRRARLWEHSGLSLADIDVPQLYDGFSPFVWFWLEALGYCPGGEAHRFVADGGISQAAGGAAGVVERRGAGQRTHARCAADARVLPAAVAACR